MEQKFFVWEKMSGTKNILSRTILIWSGTKLILSWQKDEAFMFLENVDYLADEMN